MKHCALHKLLLDKGFVASGFNTNNAWGFGGASGTSYLHPDGREVQIGTAYFRHLPSQSFCTISSPGKCRMEIKPKALLKLIA